MEIDNDIVVEYERPLEQEEERKSKKKKRRIWGILIGVLVVIAVAAVGGWFGYENAISLRMEEYNSQVAIKAVTQYQLGLQDMVEGRYEMAKTRFEYVIQLDPHFPDAADKLAQVMLQAAITMTVEPTPLPSVTPEVVITDAGIG